MINLAVILAAILTLIYIIARMAMFLSYSYAPVDRIFAGLLIAGESFVLMHSFGYVVNLLKVFSVKNNGGEANKLTPSLSTQPAVAVLVAVRHEPGEVLRSTFSAINALSYKNKQVFLLDDSSDEKYRKEAEELAQELSLTLFRRETRHGAKAGIINDCLKTLTHKYVVFFDADQSPLPKFMDILVPLMESNEKLAFIQTPQFYSNIEESRVAKASTFQQSIFYEYICEGKSVSDAMFCCGTNVIFRLEALKEVGGLDETSITEDFATSVKLHIKGWRSLFYPHTYTFGMGPENLQEYFKQQFRWATGTLVMFKKLLLQFIKTPFST